MQSSNRKVQTSDKLQKQKNQTNFDLEERMAGFSESIILLCRNINKNEITRPLVNQLIRSATSIGANYCEANNASSKKDFRNKAYIAKKEANETKYWLRIISVAWSENKQQLRILWQECHEFVLILQAILNKVDNQPTKPRHS